MKNPQQLLVSGSGNVPAADVVRQVAAGEHVPMIRRMFPYYPATELYGKCAPSFTLEKFGTGEPYTFNPRSSSGRPTLLVFWSSTCKHCQVEIPNLVAWLGEHPGTVDVVSVTYIKPDRPDKPEEPSHRKVTELYIKNQGVTWTVLEDPDRAVEDLYGVVSTPTAFFISPGGAVTSAWFYAHPKGFPEAMEKALSAARRAVSCQPRTVAAAPKMQFQVVGDDGKHLSLDSLVDKPALVHFWATWCKPCRDELPSLLRFRDAVEKSGEARVLFVSVEDTSAGAQIEKFEKALGSPMRSYRAPKGGLADRVDLSYRVPRTYLLAPGGFVVGTLQGGQNWDDPRVREKVLSRLRNSKSPM